MTWFWLLIASGAVLIASSFANVELAEMYLEQEEWAVTAPKTIPSKPDMNEWEIILRRVKK